MLMVDGIERMELLQVMLKLESLKHRQNQYRLLRQIIVHHGDNLN